MIVVFGATGNIGSALVKELAAKGAEFKAAVRDPEAAAKKLGDDVQLVKADLADKASVEAAVAGADKVFLVCGHGPTLSDLEKNVIDAAEAAGVKHFVKTSGSSLGIKPDSTSVVLASHYAGEQAVKNSKMAWTIIQPNFFMQSLLMQAASIANDGKVVMPLQKDASLALVDTRDVGAAAAAILTSEGHDGQTYYVSGAETSLGEFVEKLSSELGKDIQIITPTYDAAREVLTGRGVPGWLIDHQMTIMELGNTGGFGNVSDTFEKLTGNAPRTLDGFIADFKGAFA